MNIGRARRTWRIFRVTAWLVDMAIRQVICDYLFVGSVMKQDDEIAVRLLCVETLLSCFLRHITAGDPSGRSFLSVVMEEAAQELEDRSLRTRSGSDSRTILRALDHLDALRFSVIQRSTTGH